MYTPCSLAPESGVQTRPDGDAVSLPWGIWGPGWWPSQLGLLAQKAQLCRASWANVGARCGQLLTEHFYVAPPCSCSEQGTPYT